MKCPARRCRGTNTAGRDIVRGIYDIEISWRSLFSIQQTNNLFVPFCMLASSHVSLGRYLGRLYQSYKWIDNNILFARLINHFLFQRLIIAIRVSIQGLQYKLFSEIYRLHPFINISSIPWAFIILSPRVFLGCRKIGRRVNAPIVTYSIHPSSWLSFHSSLQTLPMYNLALCCNEE